MAALRKLVAEAAATSLPAGISWEVFLRQSSVGLPHGGHCPSCLRHCLLPLGCAAAGTWCWKLRWDFIPVTDMGCRHPKLCGFLHQMLASGKAFKLGPCPEEKRVLEKSQKMEVRKDLANPLQLVTVNVILPVNSLVLTIACSLPSTCSFVPNPHHPVNHWKICFSSSRFA